jgi:hypothetical protein
VKWKKRFEFLFEVDNDLVINKTTFDKPKLSDELNTPVLDIDRKKVRTLPLIYKSAIKIPSLPDKIEPSIESSWLKKNHLKYKKHKHSNSTTEIERSIEKPKWDLKLKADNKSLSLK